MSARFLHSVVSFFDLLFILLPSFHVLSILSLNRYYSRSSYSLAFAALSHFGTVVYVDFIGDIVIGSTSGRKHDFGVLAPGQTPRAEKLRVQTRLAH